VEDALVEGDPQFGHRGHDDGAHRRQVAAKGEDAGVVQTASLAEIHELGLALVRVPRFEESEHGHPLDLEQLGKLAQVELVVGVGQGYSLGSAGRPRGVDDRREVVG